MSILMFILFGLIVGFLARAIMPGRQSMGFVATALVGIAGSFVGGIIGNLVSGLPLLDLHAAGLIGSVLGALAVLALMGYAGRRRAFA
ncbi:MAG TPA: GlsB/YeaQ/YmgE family stress response membrane protein [Labilithrix sp.]|jgi:uncharacterized membrane protein YeaQ/YmgE (transglycosylase-associated protein family)|nr:GlsB/YeaQ/YmgE family stress response membrane protein [Labilithrix sp.]